MHFLVTALWETEALIKLKYLPSTCKFEYLTHYSIVPNKKKEKKKPHRDALKPMQHFLEKVKSKANTKCH